MKAATAVLRHEHEAIVLALRILTEIDRHAIAHDQVHLEDLRALVALSHAFERFELQVMGPQRHEALHGLLHQLQTRYSV